MTWRRWVLSGGAVVFVAIVVAAVFVIRGGSSGEPAKAQPDDTDFTDLATRFLQEWSWGRVTNASALTDQPTVAAQELKQLRVNLTIDPQLTLLEVTGETASFQVDWKFDGSHVWSYHSSMSFVSARGAWVVQWAPSVIHPKLTGGDQLVLLKHTAQNAVVDRDGKPLVSWQRDQPQAVDPNVAPLLLPVLGREASALDTTGTAVAILHGNDREIVFGDESGDRGPLTTTLSSQTQAAAQAAVDGTGTPAMLVAIQPSTGDILAVAQNPAAQGQPSPLTGLYAPGSTFKIATATAVLESGTATADTVEPCPSTVQIGQRTIPNDDDFSFPPLPLHSAFARSCNTTFAQLASGLPANALVEAANQFGINADFDIPGISTEAGKVIAATNSAEQVESAIGQGTVQVSPFGAALMAATVASGHAVTPKLWHGLDTQVNTGYQGPPSAVITALRPMMREVVTGGTAKGLRGSGQVYGKTGTAQFGDGSQANGWFVGYRGDVAFAVLLLGSNSSTPAVSIAAAFLR